MCFDLSGLMSNQFALQGCLSSPLWPPLYLTKNKIKKKKKDKNCWALKPSRFLDIILMAPLTVVGTFKVL